MKEEYQEIQQKIEQEYMKIVKEQAIVYNDFCKNMTEHIKVGEKSESCENFLLICAEEVEGKLQKIFPGEYISEYLPQMKSVMIVRGDIRNKSKELEGKVIEVTK